MIIKTISIRRAPWADFNDKHPPFKTSAFHLQGIKLLPEMSFLQQTGPRTHWSGTHSIPVLRDVETVVTVSYVYTKRENGSRIIAGRTAIAEFSNVEELMVKV